MSVNINGSTGVSLVQDGVIVDADIVTLAASKLTGALPAIDGASLTSLPVLGVGQTWQLVTGSRAASTTYTNTTGKPIAISIRAETTATAALDALFVVGGVNAWNRYCGSIAAARFSIMAIVPTGATYSLTIPTGTAFDQWAELR